jgi:hypothetical protein
VLNWFGSSVAYATAPTYITSQAATALIQASLATFAATYTPPTTTVTTAPSSSSSLDAVSIAAIVLASVAVAVALLAVILVLVTRKSINYARQSDVPMK